MSRFLSMVVMTAFMLTITSVVVMISLGAAHSHDARVPALGYWATLWLVIALNAVVSGALIVHEAREDTS